MVEGAFQCFGFNADSVALYKTIIKALFVLIPSLTSRNKVDISKINKKVQCQTPFVSLYQLINRKEGGRNKESDVFYLSERKPVPDRTGPADKSFKMDRRK